MCNKTHLNFSILIIGIISLSTLFDAKPSQAAILNGGFESGNFTDWSTLGRTRIITSAYGSDISQGIYSAVLSNISDQQQNPVTDLEIESFLGLTPNSLDELIDGNATYGSTIKQSLTARAGDIVRFKWNFLTNENTPNPAFNDFAFVAISGLFFEKLADTFSSFIPSSSISFVGGGKETGLRVFSYTFTADGTYTLGFGVLHKHDRAVASALLIDDVQLESNIQLPGENGGKDSVSQPPIGDHQGEPPTNQDDNQRVPEPSFTLSLLALGAFKAGSVVKALVKRLRNN